MAPKLGGALSATVLLAIVGTACGPDAAPGGSAELGVVTAFYPIELAASRVGGTFVDVANLTPPGGEPHDLELRPSDVTSLHGADLVLYFGGGFQPAIDDAIDTLQDQTTVVDLLEGMPLQPAGEDAQEEGLTVDPHVWLSPVLMQKLVERVAGAMAEKLPSRVGEIRASAATLADELGRLDEGFRAGLASCARREIFTSHAAFAYLTDRYSLRQVPISGLTPEAEPSSKRLREIAAQARRAGATTIFFETLVSPRVSEAVARIVGAETAVLDPLEGLSPEDGAAGGDYFSVMRSNLDALVEALDCRR